MREWLGNDDDFVAILSDERRLDHEIARRARKVRWLRAWGWITLVVWVALVIGAEDGLARTWPIGVVLVGMELGRVSALQTLRLLRLAAYLRSDTGGSSPPA